MLISATPDEQFVTHINGDLGINAQIIRSRLVSLGLTDSLQEMLPDPETNFLYEPGEKPGGFPDTVENGRTEPDGLVVSAPEGVSRFRYPMVINRLSAGVDDSFDSIAAALDDAAVCWDDGNDPLAAVVFNSALRSNWFDEYLSEEWEELHQKTRKDNGYDTNAPVDQPDDYAVLNTTSKGEVGLDFDLRRLIVVAPYTATAFIQRVGRAACRSPAIVDVYGLNDPM